MWGGKRTFGFRPAPTLEYDARVAESLPDYYSSLGPFREALTSGWLGLMYHKLGPRPSGVRHKGLYVGAALFESQLDELAGAGFRTSTPSELLVPPDGGNQFLLTFDDGFANILKYGLAPMSKHGFRAIQYLVADRLGKTNEWETSEGEVAEPLMDAAQVRDWIAAGHLVGAHSLSHPWLTRVSPAQAKEEISGCRRKLEDLFGIEIRDFCYPYGDWNPAIREMVLEARYATACTTEKGVNGPRADPLTLRRFMARYPSRHWRQWWKALRRRF